MENTTFEISDKNYVVSLQGSPEFKTGPEERLSTEATDITFHQDWYNDGHKSINFLTAEEFAHLQSGLSDAIERVIASVTGKKPENFELTNYHHIVKNDEDHYKIVSITRDLFPEDFNFPILEMMPKFERILGFKLTDINPFNDAKVHIVVRINRPKSKDYNPPHKDIYEGVDRDKYIPRFVNLWVPIAGVTMKSSLPVAPKSHLLPENEITRTFEGGVVEGNKYRVRMVKEWGGSNRLIRTEVKEGEVLMFSSHLVHGLAVNEEEDKTRFALEFRLFKDDSSGDE